MCVGYDVFLKRKPWCCWWMLRQAVFVFSFSIHVYHLFQDQRTFQEPKLEVPTIYKAYFSGLCKGISLENMPLYGTVPSFQDPEIPIDRMVVGYRWANCWNVHSSWYGENFTAWIRWTNRNSSSMFETIFPRTTTSSTNRNQNQGGLFTLLSSNPVLTGSTQSVIICDHFHLRTLPYSHLKTGVFSNNMTPLVARDIPVSWAWLQIFPLTLGNWRITGPGPQQLWHFGVLTC